MFARFLNAVARRLGRNDFRDLSKEARLIVRDIPRKPYFNVSRFGHGGSVTGALGPFRFVLWPGGLGDNPIVHPPSLCLMFGPWRKVTVRVGRYSIFTELTPGKYGYLRVWRWASLPATVRENACWNDITRRDLGLFPMVWRVTPADLPIPQVECADCGESFAYFELEDTDRDGKPICYECAEALEEAIAMDRHDYDSGEADEYLSSRIDSWDEVYA